MLIKEYQELMLLDSGSTTYVSDLSKRLNIDVSLHYNDVMKIIAEKLDIKPKKKLPKKLYIGKKLYIYEKDILDASFEQFDLMESILAEDNNVQNMHKLLAIYLRPVNWNFKIKKFNINDQEKISLYIKDNLEIEVAFGLLLFFYNSVLQYIVYMSQHFSNLLMLVKS